MNKDLNVPKALILDDEDDARLIVSNILKKCGYDPTTADNLTNARTMLRDQSFKLLFFDFNLPDGTSVELLEDELVQETPTIICSAFLDREQERKLLNMGVLACIQKPLNQEKIILELGKNNLMNV